MERSVGNRILAVSGRPPSPAIDGDSIANLGLLTSLSQSYSVTLLTVGDQPTHGATYTELDLLLDGQLVVLQPKRIPRRSKLHAFLRLLRGLWLGMPTRYLPGARADLGRATSDLSESKDVVVFLDNRFAHLVHNARALTVLHLHNVDGWSYANQRPSTWVARRLHTLTLRQVRAVEGRAVRAADAVTVTSVEESERLFALYAVTSSAVVPSGVPIPESVERRCTKPVVGWLGSHAYGPNAAGLKRFLEEAWPHVASTTGAEFWIGGNHPPPYLLGMHGTQGINVLGFVDDISMMLANVSVGIVPLWHGAGVKLKTLTMMAHMVPVVSTSVGAEGVGPSRPSSLVIADTPSTMAHAVIHLLNDAEAATRLGCQGRALVQACFSWDAVGASMRDVIDTLISLQRISRENGTDTTRPWCGFRPS